MRRSVLLLIIALLAAPHAMRAQANPTSINDSLFRRAKRMVSEGNGRAGRALVDSVLRRTEDGTTEYGNALYWRGALAETAAEAERDYRRVIVEYPLSLYVDDALLAIAELEQARGDRAGALLHLQRFVREHPVGPARGVAAFAAARLAFEQRDMKTACGLIADARTSTPETNIELRNQIDYYGGRCTNVATTAPAITPPPARDTTPVPSKKTATKTPPRTKPTEVPKAAPVEPPVIAKVVPPEPAPVPVVQPAPEKKARGIYTIQLAAYSSRTEADRMVAALKKKDLAARVSGDTKPFRVRLDFYPTRADAVSEVAALKERGIIGFVTTEDPPASTVKP